MRHLCLFVSLAIAFSVSAISLSMAGEPNLSSTQSAAELYTKYCATCHGRDGRAKTFKAKSNHARDLTDPKWQNDVGDERLFNSIMNGKRKMPAFGKKLSEQEINALVSYVRSLKRSE